MGHISSGNRPTSIVQRITGLKMAATRAPVRCTLIAVTATSPTGRDQSPRRQDQAPERLDQAPERLEPPAPRFAAQPIATSGSTAPLQFEEQVPLAPLTTFGIGGPARFFARIRDERQIVPALRFAEENHLPYFVLGGGSNLLVADAGYPGLILHIAIDAPVRQTAAGEDVILTATAGMDWDALVRLTCAYGLAGMECLAGIPGSVGGTPVQNVGAYGQEVSETIAAVRAYDRTTGGFVSLSPEQCNFAYRRSIFNTTERGKYIVSEVSFRLQPAGSPKLTYTDLAHHFAGRTPALLEVYNAVREIRSAKGMVVVPGDSDSRSAGSFFKNPVVAVERRPEIAAAAGVASDQVPAWPTSDGRVKLAAAWLLDRAGFGKGYTVGRSAISSRHTLALTNLGGATAAEVLALRDEIVAGVQQRFGIALEQEPVMLGF
jgi:UDP-N-acetylmuramate dehydrogenase